MTLIRPRLTLVATATLLAVALAGCGRRGPLELPEETLARAAQVQQNPAAPKPAAGKVKLGDEAAPAEAMPIPGTTGNRPPQQYPFPLDPLL